MTDTCSEPARAIKPIDQHSVHQICSGQVVLSLATAVKELVENSIDAGATNVEIRLKDYGADLVEVSDNGKGVDEANFEGLTLKHHTSKLNDFSDLIHVETFGFRGEALSSLCALSELSVITCHESVQVGTRLIFDHDGKLTQRSPHPRQQGTTVTLQHLFYTLPVRHKEFQRNIKKEYTKMIHVLQSYCIISTGVRITCTNQVGQGKRSVVLCTSGSHTMKDNIGAVFGPKQLQSLLPFQQLSPTESIREDYGIKGLDLPEDFFKISGFVSQGDHGVGRSATDRQFFFINNRPCDPSKVSKLVNEVYHMFNRHQYPFVALNIAVASDCVDVNVTPDKRQIFLQEEKLLLATLKSSLIAMYESGVNKISLTQTAMPMPHMRKTEDQAISFEDPEKLPVSGVAVENREVPEPTLPYTKSSLNLAGLRAAFSLHQMPDVGTKANSSKVSHHGPAQKKLQSFFCGTENTTSTTSRSPVQSLFKHSGDALKQSPAKRPVLEENVDERKVDSDIDSGRESIISELCSVTGTPDSVCGTASEFSSPDTMKVEPGIKSEITDGEQDETHKPRELSSLEGLQPPDFAEESSLSPGAKRARLDKPLVVSSPQDSGVVAPSNVMKVDTYVHTRKRTAPLQFSLSELAGRLQKLQEREKPNEELKYRRFRAKINPGENQSAEDELKKEISKGMFQEMEIIGQFNLGFIITKLKSDLFMIDQHATDEKYNFETLQQHTVLQGQRLIAPQKLHLPAVSETVLIENLEIFRKNGFDFLIDEDAPAMEKVKLISLPTSKNWTFGPSDIEELIFMLNDSPGVMCRPSRVRQMFASRACRKSVMIGTALNMSEMKKLVVHMGEIEQPWNCPHGRPTMRHLANLDMLSQD